MNTVFAIALGGAFGAVMRHFSVAGVARIWGSGFPFGTLFVNVLGSFLIGLLLEGLALKFELSLEARAFLVTGFLGGFTTFSAFSLDVFKLVHTGQAFQAGAYVLASVALSLIAVFAGAGCVRIWGAA